MRSQSRRGAVERSLVVALVAGVPAAIGALVSSGAIAFQGGMSALPPVPVPSENPITEEKRVLGKILYWDEQLSSDNTTSCGTCHIPDQGGADPRLAINPGPDLLLGTPDDIFGSPGVVLSDDNNEYLISSSFGNQKQVTGRSANTVINAAYSPVMFWDGRAGGEFIDPETGAVSIATDGALESQAVGPPLSDAEMSHMSRDWPALTGKLASSRPLALATDIPADMADAIAAAGHSYQQLFIDAFGDSDITAERIAWAIATYERTLISDQTPFDAFMAGDPNAMTPQQQAGWNTFQASACQICHIPPLFTDHSFRNIGVRPNPEDLGLGGVTGLPQHNGRFKTPTLRNVGLKSTYMHNGGFTTLADVMTFYAAPPGPGNPNLDPLMPVLTPPMFVPDLIDFMENALTDPRVEQGLFPFDRPTLRSELGANPSLLGGASAGTGGLVPTMIAQVPPNAGNADFRFGVTNVNENDQLNLVVSRVPPAMGVLSPLATLGPFTATTRSGDAPAATAFWSIPDNQVLDGDVLYFQWQNPLTGARSRVAQATLFCGTGGCSFDCLADVNGDGTASPSDFTAWLAAFNNAASPDRIMADVNGNGALEPADFTAWLGAFNTGCP